MNDKSTKMNTASGNTVFGKNDKKRKALILLQQYSIIKYNLDKALTIAIE